MTLSASDLDQIVSDAHARLDMAANIIKSAMGSEDLLASAMSDAGVEAPTAEAAPEAPAEEAAAEAPVEEAAAPAETAPEAPAETAMAEAMGEATPAAQ